MKLDYNKKYMCIDSIRVLFSLKLRVCPFFTEVGIALECRQHILF